MTATRPFVSRLHPVATLAVLILAFAAATTPAEAQAPQRAREYVIELTTSVTAPMFAMPSYPGMPAGMGGSQPSRSISGEATYFRVAVEPIFVTVPSSLGLPSNRLNLRVSRFEGMPTMPQGAAPGGSQRVQIDMTTRQYWHEISAHGPLTERIHMDETITTSGTPRVPQRALDRAAAEMDRTASGSEDIQREGSIGRGSYVLNTGSLAMPLDGFLLPITVTQPQSLMTADLSQPLEVTWLPDSGARGWILHGRGMIMEGQSVKEIVLWVSTESTPPERVREGYDLPPNRTPSAGIASDVANRILLPPGSTRCVVPGGIFANVDMLTLTVTAIGDDYLGYADSCTLRGRIRSTWTATRMKSMSGMGGYPGAEGHGSGAGHSGAGAPGSGQGMPPGYPAGYPGMPPGFDPSAYGEAGDE